MANDLELKREAFYLAVEQLTCLKKYIAGVSLKWDEKYVLYSILAECLKLYPKEEKISAMLMSHAQENVVMSDEVIDRLFPDLIQAIDKYHLDSVLLSDIEFILEDVVCQYMSLLELPEKERCSVQATLAQERTNFLAARRTIFNKRYEKADTQNRKTYVKNYIENIQRHFAVWAESSLLTGVEHQNIAIDLKHFDLSAMDFRGTQLQQIDFSDSRLDGSCLHATGISASQLAKTIGFTRTVGLPTNLIQKAQAILYNNLEQRIKERMLKLDNLSGEITRLDVSMDNEDFFFLRLKKFECLNELQTRLKMHASAQKVDSQLLEDLTSEQRLSIGSMLIITEEKGKAIKVVLSDRIDKVQISLLPQCLIILQDLLQKKDFSEILNKFKEVYPLLITEKEDDIIKPQYFDEVNSLRQRILDLELDCIRIMFIRVLENGEDFETTLTMVGHALEQFSAIMAVMSNKMPSPQLIAKMNIIHQDYIRYCVESKIKMGAYQEAERRIEEFFGENKKLHYSTENESTFIDLQYALKLSLIEKYIELGDFTTAQGKMGNLINECKQKGHILNMTERTAFANSHFWQGIVYIKNTICLDSEQIKALSQEQQQQYHELFFEAVKSGDLERVQQGIDKFSWQVNIKNEVGYTPIITACWYGHLHIAKHIFAVGGEIIKIERFGQSINPLDALIDIMYKQKPDRYKPIIIWLVRNGLELTPNNALVLNDPILSVNSVRALEFDIERKEKLRELLITAIDQGADVVVRAIIKSHKECIDSFPKAKHKKKFFSFLDDNKTEKWVELPLLHRACAAGQVQVVNALLFLDEDLITPGSRANKQEDLITPDSRANKQSALMYLTEVFNEKYPRLREDFTEFKNLYDRWQGIASLLCAQGAKHTLYSFLIFCDNIQEASYYINGKNINLSCDVMGNTPLHLAIKTRNLDLARWLIKEKAALDVVDYHKKLPLYNACCYGDIALARLLLEAGASVDGPRRELTALEQEQLAVLSSTFIEMQEFLNKKPLSLKIQTPLHGAISCKQSAIIELLCLHGANVEEKYNGNLPLHRVIQDKDVKGVQILLRYGANSLARNQQQESALQAAVRLKHIPIIILLVDAYLNQCPERGKKDETIKWIASELGEGKIRQRFYDAWITWANGFVREDSIQPISVTQTTPRLAEAVTSALSTSSSSLFSAVCHRNIESHLEVARHLSTFSYDEKDEQGALTLDPIISDCEDEGELLPPESCEPIFYNPPSPRKKG